MLPFQQAVSELLQLVGPTLTALVSGSEDRRIAQKWLSGEQFPTHDEEGRIYHTLTVLNDVSEAQSEDIARAWFIGANCDNMTRSPAELIRESRFREVEASARQMMSDSFS